MIVQKTCLVVIYNHNYEKNISVIRSLYQHRFSHVIQLMPFYSGSDNDVIRVFGNSFQFHAYIVQAQKELVALQCDRYLFIGDDLVLNPMINEGTLATLIKLDSDKCYYPEINDVSSGECLRGTLEAHNFKLFPAGIDRSALKGIPCYEDAFSILNQKGLMRTTCLSQIKPYFPLFEQPWIHHLHKNYKVVRARLWHIRNALKYRFKNKTVSYPVVFGYSDIFSVPRVYFDDFCNQLAIFASIQMFVELAIPTTFALNDWPMIYDKDLALKPLNVWFPLDPRLIKQKEETIAAFERAANFRVSCIEQAFPKDLLYMHPVKLSRWT